MKAVPLLTIIRYTLFDNNIISRTNFINSPRMLNTVFPWLQKCPKNKKNGIQCRWLLYFCFKWLSSLVTSKVNYKYIIHTFLIDIYSLCPIVSIVYACILICHDHDHFYLAYCCAVQALYMWVLIVNVFPHTWGSNK